MHINEAIPTKLIHEDKVYNLDVYWVLDEDKPEDSYVMLMKSEHKVRLNTLEHVHEFIVLFKSESDLQILGGPMERRKCENLIERGFRFEDSFQAPQGQPQLLSTSAFSCTVSDVWFTNPHGPFKAEQWELTVGPTVVSESPLLALFDSQGVFEL